MDLYNGIMIDASTELREANENILMYTESVIKALDLMEENELIKTMFFAESTDKEDDSKDEEDKNENKNSGEKGIIGKIGDAITTIFHKIISLFTKGKTSAKGIAQNNGIKKIAEQVRKHGSVKVKIQDVWSFSKFANKAIDDYTKGFDRKTVDILNRVKGKDKAIKVLIDNLNKLAKAMREPAIRRFTVAEGSPSLKKKIAKGVGLTAAASLGVSVNTINGAANTINKLTDASDAEDKGDDKSRVDNVNSAEKSVKKTGVINLAIVVGAIAAFFIDCPKQIGSETISIQDLYSRLVSLKPGTFPQISANKARNVSTYMQREENLKYFRDSEDGSKAAIRFSQEMSELLTAYTNFYQSMIDYYFSIIVTVLKAGDDKDSTSKVTKPDKVISVHNDDGDTND